MPVAASSPLLLSLEITSSMAVVMRKDFGNFDQAVAAAALNLLSDLQMQSTARLAKQPLVERVSHQCMFENIVVRFIVPINQVKRL